MARRKTIRIPFTFTLNLKKIHNGVTHSFNNFLIEGWGKKKGKNIIADIDKIYLDNNELKGDLECLEGIDEIEKAAAEHVSTLFNTELQVA